LVGEEGQAIVAADGRGEEGCKMLAKKGKRGFTASGAAAVVRNDEWPLFS
jgi:hypothetical protein